MREFNLLSEVYPQPTSPRSVGPRTIQKKLIAMDRDEKFFDGDRSSGYGGLRDDRRWQPVARKVVETYGLSQAARVLQIEAEKAFLLSELLLLGITEVHGTESSDYARRNSAIPLDPHWPEYLLYQDHSFDFIICLGGVYVGNLKQAVQTIKGIERVGKGLSFVTLASFDSPEDERLMRQWSLLGTTILSKPDWIEVLKFCGYRGDYSFVTARTLNLQP